MGIPNGPGGRTRLRTAGLALLLFAVLAFVIGSVVTLTRGGRNTATQRPPIPAPASAPASPSTIPYPPPMPSFPAQPPAVSPLSPSDAAESAPAGAQGSGQASPAVTSHGQVRVYNNSTIRGLAARAARDLTAAGWTVVEVGNYARGTIPTTTTYYQDSADQRADAAALGNQFGMRVEPRFPGIASVGPGLIVIVTNDYRSP
ncbi:MAG: LytR C-terminal domain-containing protein [Pseudonocardiaceae bacterium]